MPAVLLDYAGQPVPPFAAFLSTRIPIGFLRGIRDLVNSGCELGYQSSPRHDSDLPYWKNIQPHERNSFVFERLHQLAEEMGMKAEVKILDNGYHYPEIESDGLSLHVKHRNNYQTLAEQIAEADYRREMTTLNAGFGQLRLAFAEWPLKVPDRAYVILFYSDGEDKSTAGSIFFVLPSREKGEVVAICEIEEAIASYVPPVEKALPKPDDDIDLPPKDSEENKEKKK